MKLLHIGWRVMAVLALTAMLSITWTSAAQTSGDEPAKKDTEKDKPKAADKPAADKASKSDKPADASADKTGKNAKQVDDDADDEGDAPNGKAKNPKTAKKKMVKEETKYRDQMARIDRLRELAKEQNNTERLAALDKLETKLTNLHDRKMNKQRKRLSDEDAKAMDKHLEKGKAQGLIHGKGPDGQGPPGLLKKEGEAADPAKGKPDEKGKPSDGEKASKKDAGDVTTPKADQAKDNSQGAKKESADEKDDKGKGGKPDDAGASGGASGGGGGGKPDDKGNKGGGSKKP